MTKRHDPSSREAAEALLRRIGVEPTDDNVWEVYDAFGSCLRYGGQRYSEEILEDNSEHAVQCPRCGRALLRIHITLRPAPAAALKHEFEGVCPTCAAQRGGHRIGVEPPGWLRTLWWRIRGVGAHDYRRLCRRCGRTGQTHWQLRGCWRFEREE